MSRGIGRTCRAVGVWLGVTAATTAAAAAVPGTWSQAGASRGVDRVPDVLVAGCAVALALALAWLWVVTTATVVDLLAGSAPSGGGVTRRLVLLACGAAVVAGATAPAHATGDAGAERLVGLPLPERAVAPALVVRPRAWTRPTSAADRPAPEPAVHVVRPGDSLWSIAVAHPIGSASVEERWRAIWAANRALVGDDPDLIHPGQALRRPRPELPRQHPDTDTDGERR